jgi:hypothetical protein
MSHDPSARTTLCLSRCRAGDSGHALGLKTGDVLVGVGGNPWTGGVAKLKAQFAKNDGLIALSFRRNDAVWTVMTDRLDLGQWDQVPAPQGTEMPKVATEFLDNWEIVVNAETTHDLFPVRPSLVALVTPALWLAQQRLWTLLATLVAGLAVALPAGLPVVIVLWVAAGLHLWRSGTAHIRAARAAQGYYRVGVVAACSEREAIAAWQSIRPEARFRFDGMQPSVKMQAAG